MPLFLLVLLGLGGYVWYRKQQQQQPPPMFQGQANLPGATGNVTVQQLPPVAAPLSVRLTADLNAWSALHAGNTPANAQAVQQNSRPDVWVAGTPVTLIPDPAFVGSPIVLFDAPNGGRYTANASEFHWLPNTGFNTQGPQTTAAGPFGGLLGGTGL